MKFKFLLIIIFLLPLILFGQNTIGLLYAPTDNGVGLRYDKQITNIGIYTAICRGNYWFKNGDYINNHVKFSVGVVKYVPNKKIINLFSLGLNYNTYERMREGYIPVPDHLFYPISLELGVGLIINHFNIGWCYDPFKKEVVVNSGYYFKYH